MKDYIERSKVIEITAETGALETQSRVRSLPAADVAPVVHARWEPSVRYMAAIKCGACGEDIFLDDPDQYEEWSYCPLCGAKMDLEG